MSHISENIQIPTPTKSQETPNKKRKRIEETVPRWFQEFSEKQNKILTEIKDAQISAVKVAEERNKILKTMVDAIINKK